MATARIGSGSAARRALDLLLGIAMAGTFLLAAASSGLSFTWKHEFAAPSWALALAAVIVAGFLVAAPVRRGGTRNGALARFAGSWRMPAFMAMALFAWQAYAALQIRFLGDYDQRVIYQAAYDLVTAGHVSDYTVGYLSRYPNNAMLLSIESVALGALKAAGALTFDRGVAALCLLNAAVAVATGAMLHGAVRRVAGSRMAVLAWLPYLLLCGASPWFLVPYSDSLAICAPIAVAWLMTLEPASRGGRVARDACMGAVAWLGYSLKPQVVFILVGAVAVISLRAWADRRRGAIRDGEGPGALRAAALRLACIAAGLALAMGLGGACATLATSRIPTDPEGAFSPAHYLMMGLNEQTDGTFSDADSQFSRAIPGKGARAAADLGVAADRLGDMGPFGLLKHLVRKQLVTWSDGTFGWKHDRAYFGEPMRVPSAGPAALYWGAIRADGRASAVLTCAQQVAWLVVLLAMAAGGIARFAGARAWCPDSGGGGAAKPSHTGIIPAATAAILLLMAFELTFEAGARYLYAYVPIMILVACAGISEPRLRIRQLREGRR